MNALRAERASLLLARQLPKAVSDYYKLVDDSSEEQIPASRVLKVEHLESLGLAVQMYCLFLRALECDQPGMDRLMGSAWKTLVLTPEVRDDTAAQARVFYDQMRAYPIFRETATVTEMVIERCQAIFPIIEQAPELRAFVAALSSASFNGLQQFTIA